MSIWNALQTLDRENDAHWTADGMPRVDVVAGLVNNESLKRSDITSAAPDFTRETPALPDPEDRPEAEGNTDETPDPATDEATQDTPEAESAPAPIDAPGALEAAVGGAPPLPESATPEEVEIASQLDKIEVQTEPAPTSEIGMLEVELENLTAIMNEANTKADKAKKDAATASDAVNAINRKLDMLYKADPQHATSGIRAYINQQNKTRLEKAGRVQKFLGASGLSAGEVAKNMTTRSPIDAAMHGRKPARGSVRPVVRQPVAR